MTLNTLVAYASKHGATAEIATKIGAVLRQAGLPVEVMAVEDVDDLNRYAAVVLGSAVYAGSWVKDAAKFLQANEQALAKRPVWLFSSGPTGEGDPVELLKGWIFPTALRPIADRIHPRDIACFGGALDIKSLNFAERFIIRGVKAPIGDFRDWEAITEWANLIAETLREIQPQA